MADILKISTPLVEKAPVQPNKQVADPNIPFDLSNVTKVIKTGQQSEILKQNHGMIEKEASPNILMNLLKDPTVTVGFLKNIYMLQEIIKLLPINNTPLTQEIQQLFDQLLLSPEEIVPELLRQENTSTAFKGEFFDFLRELMIQTPKPEMYYGISNLLKAINGILSKQNILNSVSNSLLFLSESVKSSESLSEKLLLMAQRFRDPETADHFQMLKQGALALMKEVEGSILFSPKLEKILPLVTYNLSRFNDNPDFLQEATTTLLTLVDGEEQKKNLFQSLYRFLTEDMQQPREESHVMDVLARLLGKQTAVPERLFEDGELFEERLQDIKNQQVAGQEQTQGKGEKTQQELTLLNADKIDKIVHSLLSSPCNFTPLLHFIIPVQVEDIRSFAELWIDPNDEDEKKGHTSSDMAENIHMLIAFDVDGIGRFEAELYVQKTDITLSLLCPPVYVEAFSQIGTGIARMMAEGPYRLQNIVVDKLLRPRSLMEVFKTLPHKRTGIDVKI